MAVVDLIKLFPESSFRGHPTSHVVGLLSVLAISGSFALLTLAGKLNFSSLYAVDEETDTSLPSSTADPCHSGERSLAPSRKDLGAKKRVHFAEDVKEPRGDGRLYRLRFAQKEEIQEARAVRRPSYRGQMPANRLALYRGLRQHRLQHAASFYS